LLYPGLLRLRHEECLIYIYLETNDLFLGIGWCEVIFINLSLVLYESSIASHAGIASTANMASWKNYVICLISIRRPIRSL